MRLLEEPTPGADRSPVAFVRGLEQFTWEGRRSAVGAFACPATGFVVPVVEFWTSRQRAAHSLHEVSYRACFRPQVPRFFIERLTWAGRERSTIPSQAAATPCSRRRSSGARRPAAISKPDQPCPPLALVSPPR